MASKKRNGGAGKLTVEILVEIRDELRRTREELSNRLDQTNDRLDRLERRQTEDSVRLATELVAVANAVGQVRDLQRVERNRLEDHERRLTALEAKRA